MTAYDAIVVGARCAGSTTALALAREGHRVAIVDKDPLPSDTISTHFLFPNTVARLESLGVLDRVRAHHRLNPCRQGYSFFGHDVPGEWTPVDGVTYGLSLRRTVLDTYLHEAAVDAGAESQLGTRVTGLVGSGTDDDPVRGVELENGETLEAPLVVGADGRSSIVARSLGLEKTQEMRGNQSFLFLYVRGLPPSEPVLDFVVRDLHSFLRYPCEDDVEIVTVGGLESFTSGTADDRERALREGMAGFADYLTPDQLDAAERVSDLRVAPETLMRGFYRRAQGPGWALAGDAGHFKHPATAQGICDAVEQGLEVGRRFTESGPALDGYEQWRDERSAEHYAFSFSFGTIPPDEVAEPLFRGLTSDADASADFLRSLERHPSPREVFTAERLGRWMAS